MSMVCKFTELKNNKKIWTSGLANVACVLEVFKFKEIIYFCARHFNPKERKIKVGVNKNLIPLTLKAFKHIFKLLELNKQLKMLVADSFLESQASEMNIVQEFISLGSQVPFDIYFLDISIFTEPYKDFS